MQRHPLSQTLTTRLAYDDVSGTSADTGSQLLPCHPSERFWPCIFNCQLGKIFDLDLLGMKKMALTANLQKTAE